MATTRRSLSGASVTLNLSLRKSSLGPRTTIVSWSALKLACTVPITRQEPAGPGLVLATFWALVERGSRTDRAALKTARCFNRYLGFMILVRGSVERRFVKALGQNCRHHSPP